MRPARLWVPAFIVLFAFYQAPEGIGSRWLQQPALAAGLMLAFLAIAWAVARALGLGVGQAYALEWNRRAARLLTLGLLLAWVAKGIAFVIGMRLGIYIPSSAQGVTPAALAGSLTWLALSTFVPSIAEDIVTRGFWVRVPALAWTGLRFVLFSAIVYVANHVYRLSNGPTEWAMLFCFGLAYATALWRTGTLWAAVGLHWGWNFAGPALSLVWPYEVQDVQSGRLLSGAAHLLILTIVFLVSPRLCSRQD